MTALHVPVRQGTDEWLAYRRTGISASDIAVLLGLSPYRCEADLADEKAGLGGQAQSLPMKVGLALEDLIASEYETATGRRVQRFRGAMRHPDIEWAIASPDRRVLGEQRVVELKYTGSASRFADGIPQDIEAQVEWQLGVLGWDVADVAVLVGGHDFRTFEMEAHPDTFANLVTVAEDFRRRLDAGGPFTRDSARIKRDYPADNGSEMVADSDISAAVRALVDTRARRKVLEQNEAVLEDAIKARMADAARLVGDGFAVTWKRTKDTTTTDWKLVADGLLRQLPEPERTALVGIYTTAREGFRPFRVTLAKGDQE